MSSVAEFVRHPSLLPRIEAIGTNAACSSRVSAVALGGYGHPSQRQPPSTPGLIGRRWRQRETSLMDPEESYTEMLAVSNVFGFIWDGQGTPIHGSVRLPEKKADPP